MEDSHTGERLYELAHAGGRTITLLRGQPGDVLTIPAPEGITQNEWSPKYRDALELEWRAAVIGGDEQLGSTPVVRWYTQFGHGKYGWNNPIQPAKIISGNAHQAPYLPGRGLLIRMSAREQRLFFHPTHLVGGAAFTEIVIAVSVQPVFGVYRASVPLTTFFEPIGAGAGLASEAFPMEAQEFRIRIPSSGAPFPVAANAIEYVSVWGALLAIVDAATLADWHPIPVLAAKFFASVACQVDFR